MYRSNRLAVKELKSSAQNSSAYSPSSQSPLSYDSRANTVSSAIHFHFEQSRSIVAHRNDVPLCHVEVVGIRANMGWFSAGPWTRGGPGWDAWTGNPPAVTRPVASRWVQLCPPPHSESTPYPRPLSPLPLISSPRLLIPSEAHQTSPPRLPLTTY